jgi:hypothetical protein
MNKDTQVTFKFRDIRNQEYIEIWSGFETAQDAERFGHIRNSVRCLEGSLMYLTNVVIDDQDIIVYNMGNSYFCGKAQRHN